MACITIHVMRNMICVIFHALNKTQNMVCITFHVIRNMIRIIYLSANSDSIRPWRNHPPMKSFCPRHPPAAAANVAADGGGGANAAASADGGGGVNAAASSSQIHVCLTNQERSRVPSHILLSCPPRRGRRLRSRRRLHSSRDTWLATMAIQKRWRPTP